MRAPLAAALAIVLTFGCTEQPSPTALNETPVPSFDIGYPGYLNGPENPGNSGVYRFDDEVLFAFTDDPARDLLTTWFDAPNSAFFNCGGERLNFSSGQYITQAPDILRLLSTLQHVPIYVYRRSEFTGDCDYLANEWLYAGHASMINNDNDFFLGNPGADAFGWTAQGYVCDQDGNVYKYHEQQKALVSPEGMFWGFITENIKITGPLPAGVNNCD